MRQHCDWSSKHLNIEPSTFWLIFYLGTWMNLVIVANVLFLTEKLPFVSNALKNFFPQPKVFSQFYFRCPNFCITETMNWYHSTYTYMPALGLAVTFRLKHTQGTILMFFFFVHQKFLLFVQLQLSSVCFLATKTAVSNPTKQGEFLKLSMTLDNLW